MERSIRLKAMDQYIFSGIYIILGLVGAWYHFYKKRNIEKVIAFSLRDYLIKEPNSTLNALFWLLSSEIGLGVLHTTGLGVPPLSEVVAALTLGYTFDSRLNKAPSNDDN